MKLRSHYFRKINFKLLAGALMLVLSNSVMALPAAGVDDRYPYGGAEYLSCTDFKFIFARGSGAEVNSDRDFKPFKEAVDEVFGDSEYSYSFYELGSRPGGWNGFSYPAPGIGISTWQRFTTSLGALLSGGELHDYGDSVEAGAIEALYYTFALQKACPATKIVYAGYSQGAQVISRALQQAGPTDFFAALTFGDPKLYLPEGKMNWFTRTTKACQNQDLSDYRAYVPDCYAYQGILGGYNPYRSSEKHKGKLKAYCQYHDVICSAYIDLDNLAYGHASYAEQGTYKRAIQDVYNMIEPATYTRPNQDLAILFDNTASMSRLLNQFKSEAIKSANKVLKKGGKVALYTYGDLAETKPVELCNFETCTADNIEGLIKGITIRGGGDLPESVLSASYTIMRKLNWEIGANKSLIVLTDAGYHNPDRDGVTLEDVVELSKSIDPVNIYVLTDPAIADDYSELTSLTGGAVYTSDLDSAFADLESDYLSRDPGAIYTSTDLPEPTLATVENLTLTKTSATPAQLSFDTDGVMSFLTLNDTPVGFTTETSIELTDLDSAEPITVCVAPVSSAGYRGDSVCASANTATKTLIPKAPNTGKSK